MAYQTIIINQKEKVNWDSIINNLEDNGILWIFSKDKHNNNFCEPLTFKLIEKLKNKGLILKNVILWINNFNEINNLITNNYRNILFFVKSENYYFDKDPIREKHIWKNVEWGKRKKNYNSKGKDPSNVWILTEDDGKGKITKYVPLNLFQVVERCILCSTKENDKILLDSDIPNKFNKLKRKIKNE